MLLLIFTKYSGNFIKSINFINQGKLFTCEDSGKKSGFSGLWVQLPVPWTETALSLAAPCSVLGSMNFCFESVPQPQWCYLWPGLNFESGVDQGGVS